MPDRELSYDALRKQRARILQAILATYDLDLFNVVERVVQPYGCWVTGIGPKAVNVVGDARAYTPCVYVAFPTGLGWETIGRISTEITNRVRVSRVLMEVA